MTIKHKHFYFHVPERSKARDGALSNIAGRANVEGQGLSLEPVGVPRFKETVLRKKKEEVENLKQQIAGLKASGKKNLGSRWSTVENMEGRLQETEQEYQKMQSASKQWWIELFNKSGF